MKSNYALYAILTLVVSPTPIHADQSAHWSYSGARGPEHWSELSADYAACGIGVHQSPIDIAGAVPATLQSLRYEYHSLGTTIVNNGHTLQINAAAYFEARPGMDD